jgi:hypothetical protein
LELVIGVEEREERRRRQHHKSKSRDVSPDVAGVAVKNDATIEQLKASDNRRRVIGARVIEADHADVGPTPRQPKNRSERTIEVVRLVVNSHEDGEARPERRRGGEIMEADGRTR